MPGGYEAAHVYKNKKDSEYYMMIEGTHNPYGRKFILAKAETLETTNWELVDSLWAAHENMSPAESGWTDMPSHGELIRSGYDQKCEIDDIDRVDFLIQGVTFEGYKESYPMIPWSIGLMRNY